MNILDLFSNSLLELGQLLGLSIFGYLIGFVVARFIIDMLLQKLTTTSQTKIDDHLLKAVVTIIPVWFSGASILFWVELATPFSDQINALLRSGVILIVITQLFWVAQNLLANLLQVIIRENESLPQSSVITIIGRLFIIAFGSLFIFQYLGISITPVLTALGVGGLAVALALQPTLENLFSGLQLLLSKKIIPGNFIELESGQSGIVEDIDWRNTVVRSLSNNRIIIPNKKVSEAILTNFHQPGKEMSVVIKLGVGYECDLEHVENIVIEIATETMKDLEEISDTNFEPFVRYSNFGESAIEFSVILRVKEYVGKYKLTHEFIKKTHKRFAQEQISIPYPTRVLIQK